MVTKRPTVRKSKRSKAVSVTRRRALMRMRRKAERLTRLFLVADDTHPKIFVGTERRALRVVFTVVVEAEDVFSKLKRLRSVRARLCESDWLSTVIFANMQSIDRVKLVIDFSLADCKVDRLNSLPKDLSVLMETHHRLFKLLDHPWADDNGRAKCVVDLLQLELIWFGKMW